MAQSRQSWIRCVRTADLFRRSVRLEGLGQATVPSRFRQALKHLKDTVALDPTDAYGLHARLEALRVPIQTMLIEHAQRDATVPILETPLASSTEGERARNAGSTAIHAARRGIAE